MTHNSVYDDLKMDDIKMNINEEIATCDGASETTGECEDKNLVVTRSQSTSRKGSITGQDETWILDAMTTFRSVEDDTFNSSVHNINDIFASSFQSDKLDDGEDSNCHVSWEPTQDQQEYSNVATVKFMVVSGEVLTQAYNIYSTVQEVKDKLANMFKVPSDIIQLSINGRILTGSSTLVSLGVEPLGSIEINLQTLDVRYPLCMEYVQKDYPIPDVITVKIDLGKEETREIVVEIENTCIKKPFIGGYRHKYTGIEYHHAFSQTFPVKKCTKSQEKCQRDTQTVLSCDKKLNAVSSEKNVQVFMYTHMIPCIHDKIIVSRKYVPAEQIQDSKELEHKVKTIQRFVRGWLVRKTISEMREQYRRCLEWENREIKKQAEEKEEHIRHNMLRMAFPQTHADFNMLYNMVERWRKSEVTRIMADSTSKTPRKGEFYSLLEKEVQLLSSIEKHRIAIKEEKQTKRELDIINKCAEPVTWVDAKGLTISMDTIRSQRAREFRDLYIALSRDEVSNEERAELLVTLKYALRSNNCKVSAEIRSLLNRECELLSLGIKKTKLDVLRKRIKKLFLEFMRSPEVNPEIAKCAKELSLKEMDCNMFSCEKCCKLMPYHNFSPNTRLKKLKICNSCSWLENIALSRVDYEPYNYIMRAVRRDEQKRNCYSSVAFIMQVEDFYYLITNIWHAHSAINESDDIYQLRLSRWNVNIDWSPWNCVLLTDSEMREHTHIEKIYEVYEPEFIESVQRKHKLAKNRFDHLYKCEKYVVGPFS